MDHQGRLAVRCRLRCWLHLPVLLGAPCSVLHGEFQFMALGQPDVLPVQLPRGKNYQNAYIVTLAIPMGVAEAHARFPEFQAFLKPFAKKKYGRTKGGDAHAATTQTAGTTTRSRRTEQFCAYVYFTYILDVRINYGEIDEKGGQSHP